MVPRLIAVFILVSPVTAAFAGERHALLNDRDLDGWVAEGAGTYRESGREFPVWSVRDGVLHCRGNGFGFLRYDRKEFDDFRLSLEFRMAPGCNSGLGIRTTAFDPLRSRATRPSFYSYEIQLIDDAGKPATTRSSGSLYRYVAPRQNAIRPAGQWNQMEVECLGPRIKVILNGIEIIDVDQSTVAELREKPLKGSISLQNHGGIIEFRSIEVEERPARGESSPGTPSEGVSAPDARTATRS